jgi:sensor histidine kinase YesM
MTLSGSRALAHPLSAEFDRLGDYLELMSVRMGERLRYTLELPDDLRDVPVPPLLLQPLVENSIRHGLEPKVEGGRIAVRAHRDADRLVIEVSDTGVGLGAAPPSEGSGFGLEQVRERLATVYGDHGRMHLAPASSSQPEGGTRATLSFPLSA